MATTAHRGLKTPHGPFILTIITEGAQQKPLDDDTILTKQVVFHKF